MSNKPEKLIGRQIRDKRKALGMSQRDLAAEINYSDSAVGAFERGERSPNLYAAFSLADALGCSTEDFRPDDEQPFDY